MRASALLWWLAIVIALLRPSVAQTQDSAAEASSFVPSRPLGVEVHGFVSPGFVYSTGNNFLPKSTRGSPEFSEVGINFTRSITDQLRAGVQLFARDLGRIGNYSAKFDWFYLDYRFRDWLGLRAGRVKIPFGLYNESNDVDAARVPVLLPQSVYPVQNRDYLLAQTGGEIYGYQTLGPGGALEYRLYCGTMLLETAASVGSPMQVANLDTRYVAGGRLLWESPLDGLRLGGSLQALKLESDLYVNPTVSAPLQMAGQLPANFSGYVHVELPAVLWIGSLEYAAGGLLLAAEYSRWHLRLQSDTTALYPEQSETSERLYGMASYSLLSWFTPGVYYSHLYQDVDHRKAGRAGHLFDAALTLRFDINSFWLWKLEGHYLRGTATLDDDLNGRRALGRLDRDWSLFLAKTTLYF